MMGEVTADLRIDFQAFAQESAFELVVDGTDQEGNRPVMVEYMSQAMLFMQLWAEVTWQGTHGLEVLKMLTPGQKRVKVFCPKALDKTIKIFADNDKRAVRSMGRRNDLVTEALTWNGESWKPLRYGYDSPQVTIVEKTLFRDKQGNRMIDPKYDKRTGGFHTTDAAIGALVVQYKPGYSLFNIAYDTGEKVASAALFEEMQKCWIYGDISKASVPPVRLVAISDRAAITAQFERSFWPKGFPGVIIGPAERDLYVETPGTRETVTERLFLDENDPEAFVEVKRTTYIEGADETGKKFKLRFLNA
ncbi:MAG: hypothetical protein HQL98_16155 [Magnetococcales bacterium]|nr:hypothetical protein [Magnetococcales bacterium]